MPLLLGEMQNHLTVAQLTVDSMVALAADLEFEPSNEFSSAMLVRKTLAANAVIATASKAMEVAGGAGYLRGTMESSGCCATPMRPSSIRCRSGSSRSSPGG